MVENLSVETLHGNFDNFFVIDVREDEEYKSVHIAGTVLAPGVRYPDAVMVTLAQ